jgi:hypothetical protein
MLKISDTGTNILLNLKLYSVHFGAVNSAALLDLKQFSQIGNSNPRMALRSV